MISLLIGILCFISLLLLCCTLKVSWKQVPLKMVFLCILWATALFGFGVFWLVVGIVEVLKG